MRLFALSLLLLSLASCAKPGGANPGAAAAPARQSAEARPPQSRINLNDATAEQLMRLPGVGEVLSRRVIEYRERHGPFRRPEEIIIVEGFSERKYRAVADLVSVR
jgi:competence protein ComEA